VNRSGNKAESFGGIFVASIRGGNYSRSPYEFLAPDRWKVEGKQRIVGHGGCGGGLIRDATCLDNDLLRESLASCHSRLAISHRHA
jgi:hypothetical protein